MASVALVTFLGDLILRFGQIFITLTSGFSAYMWFTTHPEWYGVGGDMELNSIWWPTFLTSLLAYYLGGAALSIYDLAIETLLVCFCLDSKLKKFKKNHELKTSESYKKFLATHSAANLYEGVDEKAKNRRSSVSKAVAAAENPAT